MVGQQSAKRRATGDWHKADVKAALEKRGWSLRGLAAHLGLHHRTLNQAFQQSYPASERRIADALGVHPMTIWPSRYNPDGTPNGKRGNPNWGRRSPVCGKPSIRLQPGHVKSARAR